MQQKKIQVWLPLLFSLVMVLGIFIGYQLQSNMEWKSRGKDTYANGSLQEISNLIHHKYVDSLSYDSLEAAGIKAVVANLDPHSLYIPPVDLGEINADLAGNFSGIGVEYQLFNDTVTIVHVLEKGPGKTAGLLVGDQIVAVDDSILTVNKGVDINLRGLLRGKAGSKVLIKVVRAGKQVAVEVLRGSIPLPSIDAAYMIDSSIGYIRLNKFAATTYVEFMEAATKLQEKNMQQLVLDLRGNGGGLLEEATKIADELLEDGLTIVSIKGSHIKTNTIFSTKPGILESAPIVVLLDEQSASASEVLAAALQENDRGILAGRRTFGKGLVQEQFNLSNGGALRLTVARYFTPTGRSIQKPFTHDLVAYRKEVMDRFHSNNNPILSYDTTGKQRFFTRKQKVVYGNGGVTPDVEIPADTNRLPAKVIAFYRIPDLSQLTFKLFKQLQPKIAAFKNPAVFAANFTINKTLWGQLTEAAQQHKVDLKNATPVEQQLISNRIKSMLARYQWQNVGYYTIVNYSDPAVIKAIYLLHQPPLKK